MSIIEELIASAHDDTDLMRVRDGQGDIFSVRRQVDFVFRTTDVAQAGSVAGFLADYRYADTSMSEVDNQFRVVATITMSLEQQEILSVSGFMQCIAALFSVTYDGWGAAIETG